MQKNKTQKHNLLYQKLEKLKNQVIDKHKQSLYW